MKYEKWSYLYPPRPEQALSKGFLGRYSRDGWIGQAKLNGTCNVMGSPPGRQSVRAMTRHKDEHKAWAPNDSTLNAFRDLPGDGWYVFVAELLHSKGNFKNINYIHDILVADGDYLVGVSMRGRQNILQSLFKTTDSGILSHTVIDENTWLVKNHEGNLPEIFDNLVEPYYEGLVLKNPDTRLKFCFKETSNSDGLLKIRKPNNKYSF